MDGHYHADNIRAVANNGACMGLADLVKKAQFYANITYPNG
jgi:hypothetical protein